jgi:hypothetical protein
MSAVAAAIGVGAVAGLGGAYMESNATNNAAQTQANAANQASQLQYDEFSQQQANQQPWLQAGQGALSQMQNPYYQQQFNMSDFQADPGYQFDLSQGQQAINRSAAASGGLASGNTLKALNNYSQNQASNEYQNAYNRFTNNQSQSFNRLASLAGLGQTATGQIGSAGQNMANQVGQNTMGAANAQGAAGIAGANAWSNGLSNLGSIGMQGAYMNKYGGGGLNTGGYGSYSGDIAANDLESQIGAASYTAPAFGAGV